LVDGVLSLEHVGHCSFRHNQTPYAGLRELERGTQTVINKLLSFCQLIIWVQLINSNRLMLQGSEGDFETSMVRDLITVPRAHGDFPDCHVPSEHLVEVATLAVGLSSRL
jgi:hypothetical protein